ncbi:MAG: O-antigen ligase family protein [Acidimicrobiales bacterium]
MTPTATVPVSGFERGRPARPRRARRPIDATAALTVYLVLLFGIPSALVIGPLGGSGTPANMLGLAFLLWWVLAKMGSGLGVDRGRQPVRIALLAFVTPVLASLVTFYFAPFTGLEASGVYRGLVYLAALCGVALLAADGIHTLDRARVMMHRIVHGAAAVAAVGAIEFLIGWRPAMTLHIPGLTRAAAVLEQGRSSFVRVQATTLHPIELSALLGMMLPIAVHYALVAEKGSRRRRVAWIEVGLIGGVLPLALSRTGVVAAVVGMSVFALGWTWKMRGRALVVVLIGLGLLRVAVPGLIGSLFSLFSNITQDSSTTVRQERYEIAGHHFLLHPWFGRGFNTLYPATKQVFDNAYLYVATEQGAFGIAGILLFFIMAIFIARGVRLRAIDEDTRGLGQALTGSFAAMALMFATADMMSFTMAIGLLFLLLGVAGAFWRLLGGGNRRAPQVSRQPRATPRPA